MKAVDDDEVDVAARKHVKYFEEAGPPLEQSFVSHSEEGEDSSSTSAIVRSIAIIVIPSIISLALCEVVLQINIVFVGELDNDH